MLRGMQLRVEDVRDRSAAIQTELENLRKRLAETPRWLPVNRSNHGRDEDDLLEDPWRDWQFRHRVESVLLVLPIALAAAASMLTAKANLDGTGLPIFIEQPLLTWTMALLAPMSGFAIKTIWSHLRRDGLKTAYTYGLSILTVVSVGIWTWLYASQFHGLSAEVGLGGLFDEPNAWDSARETAFTMATLITEVLVTAMLAHRLDKIAARYSPDYWTENPEWRSLTAQLAACEALSANVWAELVAAEGELATYEGARDAQIGIALLAYDARRAERDDPTI